MWYFGQYRPNTCNLVAFSLYGNPNFWYNIDNCFEEAVGASGGIGRREGLYVTEGDSPK